jgi:redox-sensing transcriptional repressor
MEAPMTPKLIHRLSVYRRILLELQAQGLAHVYSHQLAALAGGTAALVRRDLMGIGFTGSPARGYEVTALIDAIGRVLDHPEGLRVALVGVGNLGRAILSYFLSRKPNLSIVAAFDVDAEKTGRVLYGCHCHQMTDLLSICREQQVQVGVITVPAAAAQAAVDGMILAGVRSFVNFAPVTLRVPPDVHVQDMDITTSVEKAGYFARRDEEKKKP